MSDRHSPAERLRERAETLLADARRSSRQSEVADVGVLAHELAVHQVELELQCDQLRETQQELQTAKDLYANLYEEAPVGYVVVDHSGIIRRANRTWGAMLNRAEHDFRGMPFADALMPDDAVIFRSRFRALQRQPLDKQIVVHLKRRSAAPLPARIEARPRVKDSSCLPEEEQAELLIAVSDMTDVHRAQAQVEQRNAELQRANGRIARINGVLRAVRTVSRAIDTVSERGALIQRACQKLAGSGAYQGAWLALIDDNARVAASAGGLGPDGAPPVAFASPDQPLPECVRAAIQQGGTLDTAATALPCTDCSSACLADQQTAFWCGLRAGGRLYGVLAVALPSEFASDPEERGLFEGLADDIALALQRIELASTLEERTEELNRFFAVALDLFCIADTDGRFIRLNAHWEQALGYPLQDLEGRQFLELVHPDDIDSTRAALARLAHQTPVLQFENRYRHSDGSYRWIEWRAWPHGRRIHAAARDVTARKLAEEATRQQAHYLSTILSTTINGFWVMDSDGHLIEANDAYCQMTGYTKEELLGLHIGDLDNQESPEETRARIERIIANGSERFETWHRRKDGSIFPVEVSTTWMPESGGRFVCFGSDLSDRRRRERRIRMLAHLLDQTQVMITVHDDQGELLYANEAALSAPGYTTATGLRQAQVGDSHNDTRQTLGEPYETSCVGPAGTDLALQSTTSRIEWDGRSANLTVATDVSELKRTSASLAQVSKRMLLAADAGQFGVWDWHIADDRLEWDEWMLRLHGLQRDDFGDDLESWRQRVHPEDLEAALAKVNRALQGDGLLDMCFRIVRADGCVRHMRAYAVVTRDQNGTPQRMIGINYDVTDQTATEAALRESEERFRLLVESSPVSVLLMQQGRYVYGNPAAVAMLGLERPEDIVGLDACAHIAPESLALVRERMATAEAGASNQPTELAIRRADGTVRWALSTSVPLSYAGEPAVLIIGQDSTERRRAEEERLRLSEQLAQAQRMESVGLLAGGVAHDFNNMLSIILGHTELLLDEVPPQSELHDDVKEIQSAAQRSADLTRQLLAFARKQIIQPRMINLNETIPSMLRMLRRLIGESISLLWKPAPGACPVMMDPSQIDQILANLCVNARDAIHDTGTVTIETGLTCVDNCQSLVEPSLAPGEYVVLSVCDTGCGIAPEVLPRIFEPFYTSKGLASGTGLGLSTVYGIATQNGGTVDVDSVVGEGTSVRVYLPLARGDQ